MAVRKTIDIDDDVRREIDKRRKETGLTIRQIVNDAMRLALQEIEKDKSSPK